MRSSARSWCTASRARLARRPPMRLQRPGGSFWRSLGGGAEEGRANQPWEEPEWGLRATSARRRMLASKSIRTPRRLGFYSPKVWMRMTKLGWPILLFGPTSITHAHAFQKLGTATVTSDAAIFGNLCSSLVPPAKGLFVEPNLRFLFSGSQTSTGLIIYL